MRHEYEELSKAGTENRLTRRVESNVTSVAGQVTQRLVVGRGELIPRILGILSPKESVGYVVHVNTSLGSALWNSPSTR